jgi:hypothetical protein
MAIEHVALAGATSATVSPGESRFGFTGLVAACAEASDGRPIDAAPSAAAADPRNVRRCMARFYTPAPCERDNG